MRGLDAPKTVVVRPVNVHDDWLHFLQDEARHTGRITPIREERLSTPEPEPNPYALDDPSA